MTKRNPPISGERDDAQAFQQAMGDARKLAGPERVRLAPAPPSPGAPHKRSGGPTTGARAAPESLPFTVEQDGELWTARANGIDRAFLRKLGTRRFAVEARLDLHGQTKREALRALERFLTTADGLRTRALLVVHGRGLHSGDDGPALRETVRDFLTRGGFASMVLAATTAPPALGGGGATLIWLRRPTTG